MSLIILFVYIQTLRTTTNRSKKQNEVKTPGENKDGDEVSEMIGYEWIKGFGNYCIHFFNFI